MKYLRNLVIGEAIRDTIKPMNKKPTLNVRDTLAENRRYGVRFSDSRSRSAHTSNREFCVAHALGSL